MLDTFFGLPNNPKYIYSQDMDAMENSSISVDEDDCASLASASAMSALTESRNELSDLQHQVRDLLQLPFADWRRLGRSTQNLQEMKELAETSLCSCVDREDPVLTDIWQRMQRVDAELSILSAEQELEDQQELISLTQSSVVSLPQINFTSPSTRLPPSSLSKQTSFAESLTLPPCDARFSSQIQQYSSELPVFRREDSLTSVSISQNNGRALAAAAEAGEAVGNFISNLIAKAKIK